MIKEKTIKVKAVKAYTKKIKIFVCDLCGKEGKDSSSFKECFFCGRLICYSNYKGCCAKFDKHYMADYPIGDYPENYCKICYKLRFLKYDDDFKKMKSDYGDSMKNLEEKIKLESLEK